MKKLMTVIGLLLVMCLLVLSCGPTVVTGPGTPQVAPEPTPAPVPEPLSVWPAFMTEMERQQWGEQGIANVDSAEEASMLAGFPVVIPTYIPEGFQRNGKIMVINHNVGKPEGLAKFDWIEVQQIYSWQGEKDVDMFVVIQVSHKGHIAGAYPLISTY